MSHRADLNGLTAAKRQQLVDLMLAYIDDVVVADHLNIIHSGIDIFTGHRAYIAGMEAYLLVNGGAEFIPLPMWDPQNQIPAEFNIVKADDNGNARPALQNLNPQRQMPAQFEWPAVCDYENATDLGNSINGWHGGVHGAVGGSMGSLALASAAPIFWCWHSFVDHVYWDWQRCQVICPNLVGLTLGMAKFKLAAVGLKVGNVTRLPKFIFPRLPELFELPRIPRPFPPLPEPDPQPFPFELDIDPMPLRAVMDFDKRTRIEIPSRLLGLFRGPKIISQTPVADSTVQMGTGIDITILD